MNQKTTYSILAGLLISFGLSAQSLDDAQEAIKEEKYDSAKKILKELIEENPKLGMNYYYLGDIFLKENQSDSARYYFNKGSELKERGSLNFIGLAELELDNFREDEANVNFNKARKDFKKKNHDEMLLIANAYVSSSSPIPAKAKEIVEKIIREDGQNAKAYFMLGRAFILEKNVRDATIAFNNAYRKDPSMLEAKLELAKIVKVSRNYDKAIQEFKEVLSLNPNYAPIYREMAETYYLWSRADVENKTSHEKNAAENYKIYIDKTDGSTDAKMKYADFLVLTKNYTELEEVANKLKVINGVNPRIFRYLGYVAYVNQDYATCVKHLDFFLKEYLKTNRNQNIIGSDFLFLGLAKLKEANIGSGNRNKDLYYQGLQELREAVKIEEEIAGEYNKLGMKAFNEERYQDVADILSISAEVKKQPNYVYDNYYLGYSYYFIGREKEDMEILQQASDAFTRSIEFSPTTEEAYYLKARTNRFINTPESRDVMANAYVGFLQVLSDKQELNSNKFETQVIEAYTFVADYYKEKGNAEKAAEYFNKLLVLDPTSNFAKSSLEDLKK